MFQVLMRYGCLHMKWVFFSGIEANMSKGIIRDLGCVLMMLASLGTAKAQVALVGPNPIGVEAPKIIADGMAAYAIKGPEEAIKVWLRNGPLDGDKGALSQGNTLRQIQDFYGSYESYDVIKAYNRSERVRIVYLVINFEKGPVYAKFTCYKSEREWLVIDFLLNTKDKEVLPTEVTPINP